jgi:hypothetical protein
VSRKSTFACICLLAVAVCAALLFVQPRKAHASPSNHAPVVSNFVMIEQENGQWELKGNVSDQDGLSDVVGQAIHFGGVLSGFTINTTVGEDGKFDVTVTLNGLQEGTATAKTQDVHNAESNTDLYSVVFS